MGVRYLNPFYLRFVVKRIPIPESTLRDLYWNKNLKPRQIAKLFGIKNERTIRKKMEKCGIKRKTLSEAMTKKLKKPFLGNLMEKAYYLGLRAGDFHARKNKECIRIQTSTTHSAQVELLRDSFQKYSQVCKYYYKPKERQDEWFIYADLHNSFEFLLTKPDKIPEWILKEDRLFFNFFAAYIDCEGNWHLSKSHEKHLRFTLRIRTSDKLILEDFKEKLEELNYHPLLNIEHEKGKFLGYGRYTNDFYGLIMNRQNEVLEIIRHILPLSKHGERIKKMSFMLKNNGKEYNEAINEWNNIKKEIKKEVLNSYKQRS